MTIGRPDYQQRRDEKIKRTRDRAIKKAREAEAIDKATRQRADMIPLGEPIKVGHHSEARHRRDIERINAGTRRAIEARDEAQALAARADSLESGRVISSDDPECVDKLRAKLAGINAKRERGVAVNKIIRAHRGQPHSILVAHLRDAGLSETEALGYTVPDCMGDVGVPAYRLSNLAGQAKSIEKRIASIEARAAVGTLPSEVVNGVTIQDADNRIQMVFVGKPDPATIQALKSNGFRWTPSSQCWQRSRSQWSRTMARDIAARAR
jgi:hypothetical protein